MARNRWTLALIIISLPILATVITAFRIRDLPKSQDNSKLETKRTQPCENCDVKVGQKVHSVKIESDKQKDEVLKKSVKDKLQKVNEKTNDIKSTPKYDVKSDEDDDDDDDLDFSKIRTGFKTEFSKDNILSESNSKFKSDPKKLQIKSQKKDYFDGDNDDDDDDDDEDDDKQSQIKVNLQSKTSATNKIANKLYSSSKNSEPTEVDKAHETKTRKINEDDDGDDDDDDEDDDENDDDEKDNENPKPKQTTPSKVIDTKKKITVNLKSSVKSSQANEDDVKKKSSDSQEKIKDKDSNNDDNDDFDGDEDDDDDEDGNSEDDDYKGLDNIDELFKILDIKPSSKQKKISVDSKKISKHQIEIKTQTSDQSKAKIKKDINDDDEDDDDDDDEDDDDDDYNNLIRDKKLLKIPKKTTLAQNSDKSDKNVKKIEPPKKEIDKQDKKLDSGSKDTKAAPSSKEPKHNKIKDEIDLKSKPTQNDLKKAEPVKNEGKNSLDESKMKLSDKGKPNEKDKPPTTIKKEDKKDVKDSNKIPDDKAKLDSAKIPKGLEKESSKTSEKEIKGSSQEVKKPSTEPKKATTDHKDIFKTPENKKDIKYDFEKPNAHKDSQRTFDYGEFEKIQVSKSHHKEKKKPKPTETDSDSREEKYLKHVTDALNRRNLLKSEFDDFYAFFPTFAPNFSRIHNPECRRHGQILLRQLRGTKLWALNMLDATAKIPSGVLQGNGIQLGDFDQCLGSRARVQLDTGSVVKVQGRYCLARLELKAEHTELEAPVYLAQAKSLIRSRIDDPGHFVPRFSTLSWGVCVPAACDHEDVEVIVKDALKHYQHKSGIVVKVKVDENDCHTDEGDDWDEWLELPVLLTLSLYGIVILLVLVATAQDFIARRTSEEAQEENKEQPTEQKEENEKGKPKKESAGILSPFSLYRSLDKLFAPGTTDEISCIHGIRAIATLALLVAHKFMPVAVMPYTNRVKITEVASSWLWSWCRAGWVFTDCFLLLSGTLSAHRMASDNTGAIRRLTSRYLRLTPALLAVVLFYAYIWDKLSTGPMWGSFVTKNADICEKSWWWNLLYVQNYFGLEDMCAPQTHQLALDMQLTILGTFIVWLMQSGLMCSKLILPAVHLTAAYFRYSTVRDHRLTLLAYHGVSVSQLYRTARLSYTSTLHRCSPYLIGISLGIALKKPAKHGKFLLTLGWVSSIGLAALVAWSGLDSGSTHYRYSANFAAQYAAIAPLASAMATAWVIYAVHSGTCDFLSRALCWRPLVFISRLSYALYLCQFIIFITSIGTVRTSREFTLMSLIDIQEIIAILLSSTILTVTFVIPMQSLHKMFNFQWKSDTTESPKEEKEKEETEQKTEEENEQKPEEKKETTPPTRSRHNLVAHREMLEEIPEMEVEYETQRENVTEGLDEIVEEEEGTIGEEEDEQMDDLEIIEEEEAEEAGEEDHWLDREGERSNSRQDDRDLDEWEWTANGSGRSGAQYYRYAR